MTAQYEMPEPPTYSSLSVSTPLHAAVESRNLEMLKHLLQLGFDPNVRPLANMAKSISPPMSTLTWEPPFIEAYELLAADARVALDLRTPIYGVHILHFAFAHLSRHLLQQVADVPLFSAGTTALGHTLLHIACFPLDETQICIFAKSIYESIHEVRSLSQTLCPLTLWPDNEPEPLYPQPRSRHNPRKTLFAKPQDCGFFMRQSELVDYLLDRSTQDLSAVDVHGNTALHYLASYRTVNTKLIDKLRSLEGGEQIWTTAKNHYGYTPKKL